MTALQALTIWCLTNPTAGGQGPFTRADILDWFAGKYFPDTLPIRAAGSPADRPFHALLPYWTGKAPAPAAPPHPPPPQPAALHAPGPSSAPMAAGERAGAGVGAGALSAGPMRGYGGAEVPRLDREESYGRQRAGADGQPAQLGSGQFAQHPGSDSGLGLRQRFAQAQPAPQPPLPQQLPLPGAFPDFGGGAYGGGGAAARGLGQGFDQAGGGPTRQFHGAPASGTFGHNGAPQQHEGPYGHVDRGGHPASYLGLSHQQALQQQQVSIGLQT